MPRTLFDHKAGEPAGGNVTLRKLPPGIGSKGVVFNNPQAFQYDSPKESRPNRPADLGATGHVQPVLEPRSGNVTKTSPPVLLPPRKRGSGYPAGPDDQEDDPEGDISMLRQPETRPISHDQLVVEVKGIYAGLVMVEAKCIDVDEQQTLSAQDKESARRYPLTNDQWRSLIALHKQLLHEHHDFFLASQHPSASSNLSKLAGKYNMPARMWRHGIHAFLEVLRYRLPASLEHMLAFIYIAYSMMALLFETVPSFEDTWIECLGDLGRYRMAIEDDEPRDREVWSNVAKYWYSKASDRSPTVGRLFHHLAILAKPYTLEHLSLYTRSLTCIVPFESAKGSILTLLNPILLGKVSVSPRNLEIEILFIKAHAILFTRRPLSQFKDVLQHLQNSVIDDFIYSKDDKNRKDHFWRIKKIGAHLATASNSSMLEYGAVTEKGVPRSPIRRGLDTMNIRKGEEFSQTVEEAPGDIFNQNSHDTINIAELITRMSYPLNPLSPEDQHLSSTTISHASELAFSILSYVISDRHWNVDGQIWKHLLLFVHIMLVFVWSCCEAGSSITYIEKFVPWAALCVYLNKLADKGGGLDIIAAAASPFPEPDEGGDDRPLWEDFLLRGLTYTLWYFPENWFSRSNDDEERQLEQTSMDDARIARILWLGHRIASVRDIVVASTCAANSGVV